MLSNLPQVLYKSMISEDLREEILSYYNSKNQLYIMLKDQVHFH